MGNQFNSLKIMEKDKPYPLTMRVKSIEECTKLFDISWDNLQAKVGGPTEPPTARVSWNNEITIFDVVYNKILLDETDWIGDNHSMSWSPELCELSDQYMWFLINRGQRRMVLCAIEGSWHRCYIEKHLAYNYWMVKVANNTNNTTNFLAVRSNQIFFYTDGMAGNQTKISSSQQISMEDQQKLGKLALCYDANSDKFQDIVLIPTPNTKSDEVTVMTVEVKHGMCTPQNIWTLFGRLKGIHGHSITEVVTMLNVYNLNARKEDESDPAEMEDWNALDRLIRHWKACFDEKMHAEKKLVDKIKNFNHHDKSQNILSYVTPSSLFPDRVIVRGENMSQIEVLKTIEALIRFDELDIHNPRITMADTDELCEEETEIWMVSNEMAVR